LERRRIFGQSLLLVIHEHDGQVEPTHQLNQFKDAELLEPRVNPGRVMKQASNNRCCVRRRCEYWLFASDCPETASWPHTDLMQCKRFHKQRGLSYAY
jgi:hypothetical protein